MSSVKPSENARLFSFSGTRLFPTCLIWLKRLQQEKQAFEATTYGIHLKYLQPVIKKATKVA